MYRTDGQGRAAAKPAAGLLLGGLLALGLILLLLLLGAAAVSAGVIADGRGSQITAAACVLGGLAGGWFACGTWASRKLIAGIGAGAVCFLLILAVGVFTGRGWEFSSQGMIELASCLCGGGAAGLLSRTSRKRKGSGKKRTVRGRNAP